MDERSFSKLQKEKGQSGDIAETALKSAPVIKIVNYILIKAIEYRASDIFIEPLDTELQVRFRIDGVLRKFESFSLSLHSGMVSRLKVVADLNIAEHRFPQDGRFKMEFPGKVVDFRISVMASRLGERVVLRVLDKERVILDIDKLGIGGQYSDLIKKAMHKPYGMVLMCGSTGSGKTTTLYAALKHIDTPEKNITTVEDPIEYQLYGINQVSVDESIGLNFNMALRSILRQDPNVILVGEIRDSQTAEMAIRSALTGHLVLSTLHTPNATSAIIRLVNMGIESFLIAAACLLVASQVLIRVLCPECKERYLIPKAALQELEKYKFNLAQDAREICFFKNKGCEHCAHTGYFGRTAIMEVLTMTSKVKELVENNPQGGLIRRQARQEGMITLRQSALDLALKGNTSFEDVLRLTASDEPL